MVYKGIEKATGEIVAIKHVRNNPIVPPPPSRLLANKRVLTM